MKILCIGNSFSQDATRYLEAVSDHQLTARNCCIGGCSLEKHCHQLDSGEESYEYQKDAECQRMISLPEALGRHTWDVVTLQQVSVLSGMGDSYEPWLGRLVEEVRRRCPNAEILLHRTWAYEACSDHPGFANYGRDSQRMYRAIYETTEAMAKQYSLRVIPAGDAVQRARKLPEFNTETGGLSLTRDGFHLSFDYGRYLAALVWLHTLTGREPQTVSFAPEATKAESLALLKKAALSRS